MSTISIFDYYDYRVFLRDFYKQQKRKNAFFSYRFIGNHVEMDSSFLIKVLQGSLHISNEKIGKFVELCRFNEKEAQYFETLVYFCKAKTEKERKLYFEKLFGICRIKNRRIEESNYRFFQDWHHSAIWSLLNFYSFKGDFRELADMLDPPISLKDAKQSIALLEELGLVLRAPDGRYTVIDRNLTTGKEWHALAISNFQREMMARAQEALERFPKEERNISTVTMNIPREALPEIDELIGKFRESLIQFVNSIRDKDSDRVYQLNVQLFPLTKKRGETV
jgi:uncharacterized protein (TIGR02147 family)